MVIIQDNEKNIIGYGRTLPKAMVSAGIPKQKYSHLRKMMWMATYGEIIKYTKYYVSKWF